MESFNLRKQTKELWKLCFHDSEAFTDLYFRLRYNDEVNLYLETDGRVTAALQILPYPITFHQEELAMGYISGACTHPDFRNKGLMGQLLRKAFGKMVQEGKALTTLIPAEPWLFDYYARFGYAPVFQQSSYIYHNQPVAVNEMPSDETLEITDSCQEEVIRFMETQYREQSSCCILHPTSDLQVVYASLQLDHGHTYLLRRQGELKAIAFATPADKQTWRIDELLAIDEQTEKRMLQQIANHLHLSQFTVVSSLSSTHGEDRHSLGMARILDAQRLLQLHAQNHPELELHLQLYDEQLPANNGYYHLSQGICRYSVHPQAMHCTAVNIRELTGQLLSVQHPHMSLMLN